MEGSSLGIYKSVVSVCNLCPWGQLQFTLLWRSSTLKMWQKISTSILFQASNWALWGRLSLQAHQEVGSEQTSSRPRSWSQEARRMYGWHESLQIDLPLSGFFLGFHSFCIFCLVLSASLDDSLNIHSQLFFPFSFWAHNSQTLNIKAPERTGRLFKFSRF